MSSLCVRPGQTYSAETVFRAAMAARTASAKIIATTSDLKPESPSVGLAKLTWGTDSWADPIARTAESPSRRALAVVASVLDFPPWNHP
ncbi:hypothetical protein FVEN_g13059 [Fusarium venenatum]|nr:hypothetical protein FVEN_g13059 [Fusarium venenatum]